MPPLLKSSCAGQLVQVEEKGYFPRLILLWMALGIAYTFKQILVANTTILVYFIYSRI